MTNIRCDEHEGRQNGRKAGKPCMAKGCKASNVAAGEHLDLLDTQMDLAAGSVLKHLPRGLAPDDRDDVVVNMELARKRAVKTFTAKTAFWFTLPHFLVILCHRCPRVVRDGARKLIEMYQRSPLPELHHRLSVFFLDASSPCAKLVQDLADGRRLTDCPLWFQMCVLRLFFVVIVERRVED